MSAELRRLAEAVPRGPWWQVDASFMMRPDEPFTWVVDSDATLICGGLDESRASYIAAVSPDVVIGLLDAVDKWHEIACIAADTGQAEAKRADAAEAAVARVRAVRADWEFLPVWGPNEQGLHILDDVDVEGLHQALDDALDGVVRPEPTRGNRPERRRTAPESHEPRQDDQSRVTDCGEAARGDE